MKIIKRSGAEAIFNAEKITAAVMKANYEVPEKERLSREQIQDITDSVENICLDMNRSLSVEEVQDLVEEHIMDKRAFSVARKYITYRYNRALVRKANSTDKQILSLLECDNEEVKQENSNKNPTVNSVPRSSDPPSCEASSRDSHRAGRHTPWPRTWNGGRNKTPQKLPHTDFS